jgi:hypothetical protein
MLTLRRLVRPSDVTTHDGYSIISVETDGVDQVLLDGLSVPFFVIGPFQLRVESSTFETIAVTRSLYEPKRPAQALLSWRGGFMDGIEQLIFDLMRSMFSAGGLGDYLVTLDESTDAADILGHVQVATSAALSDIINRQAGRRIPPSRRPTLFELTGVDAQGKTLSLSFTLKTKLSNLEFSLWL